jgi:replicative DNA helicase
MNDPSKLTNNQFEQAILSCALINPDSWHEMAIRPAHFSKAKHVYIATVIENLLKSGEPMDILTVSHQLEMLGKLAEIGGSAYLTQVLAVAPNSLNGVTYAVEVKELATRRRLAGALEKIAQVAFDTEKSLASVTSEARAILDDALNHSAANRGRSMRDALFAFDAIIEARRGKPFEILGTSSGYPEIDNLLDGFQKGWFYLVAGRPGNGKTAMLGNLAINAAKQGKKVLFFSAEMDDLRIVARMVAAEAGIDTTVLKHAGLETVEDWDRYYKTIETLEGLSIHFYSPDECRQVEEIETITRQLHSRHEVDIVFADYLQLLQTESSSRHGTREQEVTKIAQTLKRITNLQIPVVAAAQLNRNSENRTDNKPQLSDLRESGSLEQESDGICFLYHASATNDASLEFIVAKNRDGALGTCPLYYNKKTQKIQSGIRQTLKLN